MRTKVRVLANIFVEDRLDESLFQFNRAIPVYRYHAIRAFVKNCPLIKNATEEDFQTVKLITIVCSNDDNAMTILHGLEACTKNSFFDKLTKKANAVDTEAIKIELNSVYGKGAFNRDTDSISEEEEKVRVFVNIYYKPYSNDCSCQVQFDEKLPVDDFNKIVAFLKDSTLVENIVDVSDFITFKMIIITCFDEDDALIIKKGLNGFVKKNNEPVSKVDDTLVSTEDNTPKNNSISSEIEYIAKNLDDSDLFLQLAEEAAELSQACLKYVRAYRGNNPTKDSEEVYLKNILEELTDVRVSADVLNIEEDIDTYINKIHRWADRIRKKNGGSSK